LARPKRIVPPMIFEYLLGQFAHAAVKMQ
jgi:hypothetical protein